MTTSYTGLASEVATALGHTGDVTTQVTGWARGVLEELTVNGIATFDSGVAGGHTISGMTGNSMATKVVGYAGYGSVSTPLLNFCTAIVTYIQSTAQVTYSGPPPPTVPDYCNGGVISGMTGAGLASAVQAGVPYPLVSSPLLAFCTAFIDHIQTNAQVASGVIS